MTTYFVTRHPGAIEWAARQGLKVDRLLDHLDVAIIQPGDTVIGILPVNLAAEVCARRALLQPVVHRAAGGARPRAFRRRARAVRRADRGIPRGAGGMIALSAQL
jgi:putative CRISPR-associated protein (TIGR02620 family)